MTTAVPTSSELTCVFPPQILALEEALAPVAKAARQALVSRVRSSGQDFVTLESLSWHMGRIEHALSRLNPMLEGLMSEVIRKEGVGPLEVGRSAGRLEQLLTELVDGYLQAKASHADAESVQARALILGVYRHHIRNICDWLDYLVATISNAADALRRRSVEPSGDVVLTVPLNMTSPPEMAKLDALVKALQSPPEERVESPIEPLHTRNEGPGVIGTIGSLAFGVGQSGAVFGRKHGSPTKKCARPCIGYRKRIKKNLSERKDL